MRRHLLPIVALFVALLQPSDSFISSLSHIYNENCDRVLLLASKQDQPPSSPEQDDRRLRDEQQQQRQRQRLDTLTRGSNYTYGGENSTIPTATEAALRVGVVPPADVSPKVWKRAWTIQKYALPVLHLLDLFNHSPPDSKLSLACLWWKALSSNDKHSVVYDPDGLAYSLLPRVTRKLVSPKLVQYYPRLHHANVEIRTAFLDQSVCSISEQHRDSNNNKKVRLISLGAGYDVRSIKLLKRGTIDEAAELDLAHVIDAKQHLLSSRRFQKRQPGVVAEFLPTFYKVDLNQVERVRKVLTDILTTISEDNTNNQWWNIFLFEGVMIYLEQGVPSALLDVCRQVLDETESKSGFLFGCAKRKRDKH
jgi:hypothetical protein